ncbi:hypothetical protein ATE84_3871 [Aquimarina sp. MAR_2010_214]|uniref:hypothetical protein n=1 Tax=Aquimarina sp. MAR_2010_214 TaxID=1250026 RepID=UPI000CC8263E|nr:hypothetical protein [Aquimarina sp. MAR_2010_214]PKV51773.1 hypothetical protein ATE84_3871 [Aquimarina sp. MAR_2010_214]
MKNLLYVLPILGVLFFASCEKDEINESQVSEVLLDVELQSEVVDNLEAEADVE